MPDPPPDPPSLADRLVAAVRRRGRLPDASPAPRRVEDDASSRTEGDVSGRAGGAAPGDSRRFGVLLAVLLPAGPVLAWGAATIQAAAIGAETQALRRAAAPALAARAAALADRAALARAVAAPGIAATANAFARVLPPDTRLAALAVDRDGRLGADAATPDPDTLRAALRRDPRTAGLRDVGQTRGDGILVVRLRQAPR